MEHTECGLLNQKDGNTFVDRDVMKRNGYETLQNVNIKMVNGKRTRY